MKDTKSQLHKDFIKYGRWDSLEHAKNGLKGTPEQIEKLARARLELQRIRDMKDVG